MEKGAHATVIIAALKKLRNEDVEGSPIKNMGEIQTRGISEVCPGLRIGLHGCSMVQRPLPT